MMSWIISASIHLDKIWGEFELDVLIWFQQLVLTHFLLCIHAPTHVKVRCGGSQKSVSDLHTYVTMSHQRGPLCVMLFSQFPLILCSCHPNLMTMFYLPSCQLSLLLCSYATRRILCRPTTKGSSFVWNCGVCTCMPDWIMFFVFEGCLSGGWLDLRWGWVNCT